MPKLEIVRPAAGPSLRALAEAPAEVFDAIPAALYLVDAEGHLIRYNLFTIKPQVLCFVFRMRKICKAPS